jgi:hypothetical protein
MSNTILTAAWAVRGLNVSEKCVLACLADHANGSTALAWPGHDTIAAECGLTERSVRDILKKLTEYGHINLESRKGRAALGESRFAYRVHPSTGEKRSPVTPENGAGDTGNPLPPHRKTVHPTPEIHAPPNITTINQNEPIKRLTDAKASSPQHGTPSSVTAYRIPKALEKEMMGKLREALGDDEMRTMGGMWRNAIRRHPKAMQTALDEMKIRKDMDRAGSAEPVLNLASWLTNLYRRIRDENKSSG